MRRRTDIAAYGLIDWYAMSLVMTLIVAGACTLLVIGFGWMGARAARPGRVRLTPWRFLMLLAFTALIAVSVHVVTLIRASGLGAPAG